MADVPRDGLATGPDGRPRCWWSVGVPEYVAYHDQEWGRPVTDDDVLFERLVLESFQSGLSWLTILRKREAFRAAFAGFAVDVVAAYGPGDVDRLLADAGIVRNRRKIEAAITNAGAVRGVIDEVGSYAAYLWSFAPGAGGAARRSAPRRPADIPAVTPESTALAADLKRRGFVFVGPTTVYAGMQAAGLVNDHLAGCWARDEVERQQLAAAIAVKTRT
jgi:DNA-3-methyladenine glycosylase I